MNEKIMSVTKLVVFGVVMMLAGMFIENHYMSETLHDFKVEAVELECAFWNSNGDFDFKYPELTMSKISELPKI